MRRAAPRLLLPLVLATPGLRPQTTPASRPRPALRSVRIVAMSHCDVGFTAPPEQVAAERLRTFEAAVAAAERDPGFCWTAEVGWDLHRFLERHGPDDPLRLQLRAAIARRQIAVGALYVSPHTALMGAALPLVTAHLAEAEAALGYRPSVAILSDVPRAPARLVDVLAQAGVTRLLWAPNDDFGGPPPLPRNRPFVWVGPQGGRVVTYVLDGGYLNAAMRWFTDVPLARLFNARNLPPLTSDAAATAFGLQREAAAIPLPFDTALACHAFDNWGLDAALQLVPRLAAWNQNNPATHLELVVPEVFFADVEQRFGAQLEEVHTDMSGLWEMARTGMPVATARLRAAAAAYTADQPPWALALAFDHNVGGGPTWEKLMDGADSRAHNQQIGAILAAAIGTAPAPASRPPGTLTAAGVLPTALAPLLAGTDGQDLARPRIADSWLVPALGRGTPLAAPAQASARTDGQALWLCTRVPRRGLLQANGRDPRKAVHVGWRIPIQARLADVTWDGLPAGEHLWCSDQAPVLRWPDGGLALRSPTVFTWHVDQDPDRPGMALCSALLFSQGEYTKDRSGAEVHLDFGQLYPGEPEVLESWLQLAPAPPPLRR